MKYRREIDGLRAVAVLPVILFHAGFSIFSGGYVGVDVFFVISGYLITSILINELEQDKFSIAGFYERRARRILPALFFVMLACLPFAYMWMTPSELKNFGQSLVAVVFFGSNILFWKESGYFASDAELKPLLHTWSLAVEEQYYIIFPIFLLLAWRFGRKKVFWSVVGIAIISLLLAERGWRQEPSANFYLAPTRAWELLAGSICAFLTVGKTQRANNWLAGAGLGLIVFAIFLYDEQTPFPSVYALVPVVGTSLIILFAAQGTWVGKLLSMRGFVGIGLISYSAYLWHQPLFAFARVRSLTEPSHMLMGSLALAALLLAWASWHFVEKPFRNRANPLLHTRARVFAFSGVAGLAFVAIGLAGHFGNGFEGRLNKETLRYVGAETDRAAQDCHFGASKPVPPQPVASCLFPDGAGNVDVLLIGDSHDVAISQVMGEELRARGIGYYNNSYSGCPPIRGLRRYDQSLKHKCPEFNAAVYDYAADADISTVVLTARHALYLNGSRFDNGEGGVELDNPITTDLDGRTNSEWDDPARRNRVLAAYEADIRVLAQNFEVVLVYPIPEAGWNVVNYAFKNQHFNNADPTLTTSYDTYRARTQDVNALFDRLVEELPNIHGARVHDVLCNKKSGRCLNADAEGIYYYDDDHLSNTGTRLVAPVIVEAIENAIAR